jgi:hypothetical protein
MLTSAKLMRVFVLLFNARTDNEGIHTLRIGSQNIVLMFEDEDDATRFGVLLEAQDFPAVTVEGFESEEIEEFCQEAGYEAKQIPPGKLLMPPEKNAEKPDWDPNVPADRQASTISGAGRSESEAEDFSASELARIRQQLEKLL